MTLPSRIIGLDLLRGIAAYSVVLAHCYSALNVGFGMNVEPVTGFLGVNGVEIFFALSGFLIGGVLLDMPHGNRTGENLRIFLMRRWMRTLPVYYLALVAYLAVPGLFTPARPEAAWQYATFTQNFFVIRTGFFGVAWTLAIEEWFYLFLTATVFTCFIFGRTRSVEIAIPLVILAGITVRFAGPSWGLVFDFHSVVGRIDAIGYGALLAALMRADWSSSWIHKHRAAISISGFAGLLAMYLSHHFILPTAAPWQYRTHFTLLPIAAAACLPWVVYAQIRSGILLKLASFSAAISYPIYICHNEIIYAFMMHTQWHPGRGFIHVGIILAVSSAVAYVVHLLVEKPVMNLRPRYRSAAKQERKAASLSTSPVTI